MKSKGNIILSTLFIILISMVGLTLLTSTLTHIKLSRSRMRKIIETDKIYQDLLCYLHNFRQKIFKTNIQTFERPEIEYFNKTFFPDFKSSKVTIKHSFDYKEIQKKYYKKIRIIDRIYARSIHTPYGFKSNVMIDILSGKIPITHFTLFINKKINIPIEQFIQKNNITNKSQKQIIVDNIKAELKIIDFLKDSLPIDGDILSWEKIREKLGFKISEEPIEEGIYFIQKDNTIESIFIQGDVDEIVFSILEDKQKIQMKKNGTVYELIYIPKKNYFLCWNEQLNIGSFFKEKMIVNGNVWSIKQSNNNGFTKNSNLILFVSGNAVIRSSLKSKNKEEKNIKITNFSLLNSSKTPLNTGSLKSEIFVDSEKEVEIHISIITDGTVENTCSKLKILGSLYCNDLKNRGNIEITHLKSASDFGKYFHTKNFKFIENFFIDFIEEIINE